MDRSAGKGGRTDRIERNKSQLIISAEKAPQEEV
jgi:hypothetical protein